MTPKSSYIVLLLVQGLGTSGNLGFQKKFFHKKKISDPNLKEHFG